MGRENARLRLFSLFALIALATIIATGGRSAEALTESESESVSGSFPSKPIKVYVGYKPGGRTDSVARMIAKQINEDNLLSQPMIIVNKPGAAGANAARAVLGAKPDGYTVLHWSHGMLVSNAMGLNTIRPEEFHSIGYSGGGSPVWAVREDSPFRTLDDLVEHLRANPRSLVEAVGVGSVEHLVGMQFAESAGIETRLVGALGGADRLARLIGGNADIALFSAQEYLKFRENGLRALVLFGNERSAAIAEVPTARELGYDVVWANPNWWLAPPDLDAEAAAILSEAIEQAMQSNELKEWFASRSLDLYWADEQASMDEAQAVLARLEKVASGGR